MVFRVCMRYTGNRQESEDLTQEVFLKVDRGLSGFSGHSTVSTWVYRIAVNLCLDNLRAKKRRGEIDLESLDSIVVENLGKNSDRELARIELERILDQVNPDVREYLLLTQGEGMSYDQASAVTGKSASAIAKAISRFRKAMAVRRAGSRLVAFRLADKKGGT